MTFPDPDMDTRQAALAGFHTIQIDYFLFKNLYQLLINRSNFDISRPRFLKGRPVIDPCSDILPFMDEVFFYERGLLGYAVQHGPADCDDGAVKRETVFDV